MIKYFVSTVVLVAIGSIVLRIILENAPITMTWLQDITVYKK